MNQVAFGLALLAIAGAVVSWIAGARFYVQALRAMSAVADQRGLMLRAIVAWPFVLGRLQGAAAAQAAKVNKALVAFLACLLVAAPAMSVAANLARMSR